VENTTRYGLFARNAKVINGDTSGKNAEQELQELIKKQQILTI